MNIFAVNRLMMGQFIVSARKYRPSTFDSVVGQPTVANTLRNAILSGKIAHAYLFCGPRGVGKTTCARILAKTINCMNRTETGDACGKCESCLSFNESRSFNIHELDAASNNSVEDIRSLTEKVRILPQVGRYSVYIIDEVHMLSQSAFNAFLKTLEEPPAHAVFILATTEKQKILPTIMSRCQIFDFNRIRVEDIIKHLEGIAVSEGISYEKEALQVIAVKADGAMRDALSIFDQVAGFSGNNITYREVVDNLNVLDYEYYFNITSAFLEHSTVKALLIFNEILMKGFDGLNFIGGLSAHFRDLLVSRDKATTSLLETGEFLKQKYIDQSALCTPQFLFNALDICNQCEINYKSSRNQRLHVELALLRICNAGPEKKKLNSEIIEGVPEIVPLKTNVSKRMEGSPGINGTSAAATFVEKEVAVQPANTGGMPPSSKESRQYSYRQGVMDPPRQFSQSVAGISIKDALRHDTGDTENISAVSGIASLQEAGPPKPVSLEILRRCWNAYAENIYADRPRMSVALKASEPAAGDPGVVKFAFNNQAQLEDFNRTTRSDLESCLRRELQNDSLVIEAVVEETHEEKKEKLYTSEEKFGYLNKKNPLLLKLKEKLNLELE